jgi:hypothetical protein
MCARTRSSAVPMIATSVERQQSPCRALAPPCVQPARAVRDGESCSTTACAPRSYVSKWSPVNAATHATQTQTSTTIAPVNRPYHAHAPVVYVSSASATAVSTSACHACGFVALRQQRPRPGRRTRARSRAAMTGRPRTLRAPARNGGSHVFQVSRLTTTTAIAAHSPTAVSMPRSRNGSKNATRAPTVTRVSTRRQQRGQARGDGAFLVARRPLEAADGEERTTDWIAPSSSRMPRPMSSTWSMVSPWPVALSST